MAPRLDFGIGPRQKLLLAASLSPDKERGAAALEEWWSGVKSFDEVQGTDSGLFAQIHANLGPLIRDPQLAARMKGAARHVWVRNSYMLADCSGMVGVLAEAGIRVMLLKGAAMVVAVDRGTGLRPMSDCDILVPFDAAHAAVRLLADRELTLRQRLTRRDLRRSHGVSLLDKRSGAGRVDLHWQPIRNIGAPEFARDMLAAGQEARIGDHPSLVPAFEYMTFHTIVHGAEWSPFPRYDWLVDTVKILRRAGPGFDWDLFRRIAETYRFSYLAQAAMGEARRHFPEIVPDAATRGRLFAFPLAERREARIRMASPSSRRIRDELLLAAQQARRATGRALRRPVAATFPGLYRSLFGPPARTATVGKGGRGRPVLLYGWSSPEQAGRWTEGHLASLLLRYSGDRPPGEIRIRADTIPLPDGAAQRVRFHAGFSPLGAITWRSDAPNPSVQALALPARIWKRRAAIVRLWITHAVVPIEIGLNADTRALGIFVRDLSFEKEIDLVSDRLPLTGEAAFAVLWHGWSTPEPDGCWTHGGEAVARWRTSVPVPAGYGLHLDIAGRAPGAAHLFGRFVLDGVLSGTMELPPDAGQHSVVLAFRRAYAAGEVITLRIVIDNPMAPADFADSTDPRPLGLMVAGLRIAPA